MLVNALPGRIGDSLRRSVGLLKRSIRANEALREDTATAARPSSASWPTAHLTSCSASLAIRRCASST